MCGELPPPPPSHLVLESVAEAGRVGADAADVLLGRLIGRDTDAVAMLPAQALLTLYVAAAAAHGGTTVTEIQSQNSCTRTHVHVHTIVQPLLIIYIQMRSESLCAHNSSLEGAILFLLRCPF